jgi:hypothetical protein
MTFANMPIEYASNLKVMVCYLAIRQGEFVVHDCCKQKQLWGNPPMHFFGIGGIFLLCKTMQ